MGKPQMRLHFEGSNFNEEFFETHQKKKTSKSQTKN